MTDLMKTGLTLIEMLVVLIVISLIASGALISTEMMGNAKDRQMTRDMSIIKGGIVTFEKKHHCLPGDCADASSFLTLSPDETMDGVPNPANGNGNRRYDTAFEGGLRLWEHLSKEGLLSPIFTGSGARGITEDSWPEYTWLDKDMSMYVSDDQLCWSERCEGLTTGQRMFVTGVWGHGLTPSPLHGGFTCARAAATDKKLDDGKPTTGSIRAWGECTGQDLNYITDKNKRASLSISF